MQHNFNKKQKDQFQWETDAVQFTFACFSIATKIIVKKTYFKTFFFVF